MEEVTVGIYDDLELCFKDIATNYNKFAGDFKDFLTIMEHKINTWTDIEDEETILGIFTGDEEKFKEYFEKIQKLKLELKLDKNLDEKNKTIKKILKTYQRAFVGR